MARTIYRAVTLHEVSSSGATVGEVDILPGSRDGQGAASAWLAQSLGAGHRPMRSSDGALLGFDRAPPRAFSSAGSGHGGRMTVPEWPVGRVWDGVNAVGGRKRLKYTFECGFAIWTADQLNWGPASIGLRSSPSGLDVGTSIWGVELVIGQKTGDGSLFPNPGFEDGWQLQYRLTNGGALVTQNFGVGAGELPHHLRIAYLDAEEPELRIWVDGFLLHVQDGAEYEAGSMGPATEGSMITFCSDRSIREYDDGEDPWADENEQRYIVTSDEENIVDSTETNPLATSE